jgi:putative tricarboxylic transport membrane protein
MKKRDRVSSIFCIGVGVTFFIASWQTGLITQGIPGAGFFPFLCGGILIGLSLIVLFSSFGPENKAESGGEEKFFPEKGGVKRLTYTMTALVAYGICLPYGGFILTTFVFMLFMLRIIEPQRWSRVFLISLSTAVLAYFLFAALEVQLPQGILGI